MFALSMDPNNTSQEIIGSKASCVVNASQWSSYSVNQQVNTLGFFLHILFLALVFVQLFAIIIFFFSFLNASSKYISASRLEQNCFCYILVPHVTQACQARGPVSYTVIGMYQNIDLSIRKLIFFFPQCSPSVYLQYFMKRKMTLILSIKCLFEMRVSYQE